MDPMDAAAAASRGCGRGRGYLQGQPLGQGATNSPNPGGGNNSTQQGLWNPNNEHRELRRPITAGISCQPSQQDVSAIMAGSEDITKTSKLSADAQEFYPRGYQTGGMQYGAAPVQHVQSSTVYVGYNNHHSSSGVVPTPAAWGGFVPAAAYHHHPHHHHQHALMHSYTSASLVHQALGMRHTTPTVSASLGVGGGGGGGGTAPPPATSAWAKSDNSGSVTDQLRSAMHELTLNPGEFDNLFMPLGDTFCQWLAEPEVITTAINLILEQSISEPNFRYNGARLCNLLNNLDTTSDGSAFRGILLERCREENSKVGTLLQTNPRRLHSFVLFLAELFIQLELKKGTGCKISVLGEGLFEDLTLLFSNPSDDNVKCACQVLKLTGMHLEQEVSTASMDALEAQLVQAMAHPSLAPNMRILAQSVLTLRHHSWGRSPPSPAAPQWSSGDAQPANNHFHQNEPVLYGPDGQMLTAEESRFLQEQLNINEGGSDGASDEYDDGMDEELQAAFEQFLQMAPHST